MNITIEDIIETSTHLNQRSLPLLKIFQHIVMNSGDNNLKAEIEQTIYELHNFLSILELYASDDGNIDADTFKERKIH